jgi:hypothetical protein
LPKFLGAASKHRIIPCLEVFFSERWFNPHCAESPILAMKKNIFDKFQPILG